MNQDKSWPVDDSFSSDDGQPWRIFSGANVLPCADDGSRWLIDGLLPSHGLAMLFGASGVGKSFVALSMAMHVASGSPWLGRVVTRRPVLYLAGEGAQRDIANRACAARDHSKIPHGDAELKIDFISGEFDFFRFERDVNRVAAYAQEMLQTDGSSPGLIIVDTLAAVTTGADENAASHMTRVVRNLRRLSATCQSAVLIVHHSGAKGDRERGHTCVYASCEAVFCLVRGKLSVVKQREGKGGVKIGVQLLPFTLKGGIGTCVVTPAKADTSTERHELPGQARKAYSALVALYGSGANAVAVEQWRSACEAAGLTKGESPAAFRKAFASARKKLVASGFVSIEGNAVCPRRPSP